jgi:hypothetical protein
MAKEIAVLSATEEQRAIACLLEIGFSFANPASGEVSGWSASADRVVFRDSQDALEAFHRGTGIQLWKSAGDDLFLSHTPEDGTIRVYFDGYTEKEARAVQDSLARCGVGFAVEYE